MFKRIPEPLTGWKELPDKVTNFGTRLGFGPDIVPHFGLPIDFSPTGGNLKELVSHYFAEDIHIIMILVEP